MIGDCESIVELQGGSIRAEYEDGVIQFIVSLPIIENNKRIEWYMIKGLILKEISPFIFLENMLTIRD